MRFPNSVCAGDTFNGTCYSAEECSNRGGSSSGTCANGYGVCCICKSQIHNLLSLFFQIPYSREQKQVLTSITLCKVFIMSTEFDKNISDSSHDCTDYKNSNVFFMSLFKWPKMPDFSEI